MSPFYHSSARFQDEDSGCCSSLDSCRASMSGSGDVFFVLPQDCFLANALPWNHSAPGLIPCQCTGQSELLEYVDSWFRGNPGLQRKEKTEVK